MNPLCVICHFRWGSVLKKTTVRPFCWIVYFSILLFSTGISAAEIGSRAPDFLLPGSDGKNYRLSDYENKRFVVIAFFPKAFTGG